MRSGKWWSLHVSERLPIRRTPQPTPADAHTIKLRGFPSLGGKACCSARSKPPDCDFPDFLNDLALVALPTSRPSSLRSWAIAHAGYAHEVDSSLAAPRLARTVMLPRRTGGLRRSAFGGARPHHEGGSLPSPLGCGRLSDPRLCAEDQRQGGRSVRWCSPARARVVCR